MSDISDELVSAVREGRQPRCPYCGEALRVVQRDEQLIFWDWSDEETRFVRTKSCLQLDKPMCSACEEGDEAFVDVMMESQLHAQVGLVD
jgi:hypothetical protein